MCRCSWIRRNMGEWYIKENRQEPGWWSQRFQMCELVCIACGATNGRWHECAKELARPEWLSGVENELYVAGPAWGRRVYSKLCGFLQVCWVHEARPYPQRSLKSWTLGNGKFPKEFPWSLDWSPGKPRDSVLVTELELEPSYHSPVCIALYSWDEMVATCPMA